MVCTSLRQWLAELEKKELLRHVHKEVDLRYELAAVGQKADGCYALQFHKVRNASMPVVTGIAATRDILALAMGVPREEIVEHFARAQANPVKCMLVDAKHAPVKEVISHKVDLGTLPIPVHHEKDGGPYITAGVLVAKDPQTGTRNVSIHRLQVLGPNRLGILILPRHLHHFFQAAEASNNPLEVAIAIGLDPIVLLASQALTPPGFDEFTIAGALYGQPLELVKCETVDLEVPAQAEIVLEGRLLPGVREVEGPFGEYPKYYGPASPKPVIELTAMTSRRDPIYQTIVPATREHLLLGAIPREGGLLQIIRNTVPNVKAIHLTPGGTCRYHVVISIDKQNEGEAKNAIFAAFSSSQEIKHVVVVDKDVDIFDPEDVEWAIATRCQAGRDVFIVERALGNKLDPSSDNGLSDKMGIDATAPLQAEPGRFEKIRIPNADSIRLEDYIETKS
ncbi:Phenolic acid decarboxylase subunit C [Moorella thermoacetica]|uniref:Phenolic acid decarboxylase n=1 Tax=Neomoorella thermoacetica TaxID=1525 RepID=A0AAC9HFW2_NEOTH|nr:UbiD family decarboxylase [Moorella thermoacetica]AOQ22908.1 3-octaprenyl-4-hydroxybenzoate carboxy-lyase [Moorella thermoacetica]TYL10563.1 Phenolic acid decarboxylase subunit C [Moorella thermoacetica]